MSYKLPIRPRRNRVNSSIRSLVQENQVTVDDLIMPLFVIEGEGQKIEVPSMPNIYRFSLDKLAAEVAELWELGIKAVALFPAINDDLKDSVATESTNPQGLFQRAIQTVKQTCPDMLTICDVAMDPYSSDGHDGFVENGEIINDITLPILAKMAVAQAEAGADIIAPSDMMDGRVAVIRDVLDQAGFANVGILAYTAKYASAFYGPFRDALDSAPKAGDKKTYQMNPANTREALREAELDTAEGADMIMVKPGLPYLDVVQSLSQSSQLPIAVYNVSGEYAMLQAAAEKGWLDYRSSVCETLMSFKRAGADIILSYHAKEFATWQKEA
ncbi:delta-aminolevulinic acid dehydratase [Lentisphaera araneosa HTCC2155]|uniref:Delta-aminolevulinic acid dehydratase n=1 Tax=Lentisphaera araneosa HTCC2155 TaxID=313628 RepID=A6DKR5_9BACT|nr:porphobilinogen synthase [Lentisphaera araneosa]EDM27963.1 delta-aminolevulinic acid dehydratase [Lentisphaera araneosa HTCC2155]